MVLKKRVEYGEDIKPNSLYRGKKTPYNYPGEGLLFLSVKPFLKQRLLVFWGQDPKQDRLGLMMYRHSDASM